MNQNGLPPGYQLSINIQTTQHSGRVLVSIKSSLRPASLYLFRIQSEPSAGLASLSPSNAWQADRSVYIKTIYSFQIKIFF